MLALPAQGAPTEIESTPRTPENSVQRIIVKFRGHGVGAATINAQRAPVISMRELSDSGGVKPVLFLGAIFANYSSTRPRPMPPI